MLLTLCILLCKWTCLSDVQQTWLNLSLTTTFDLNIHLVHRKKTQVSVKRHLFWNIFTVCDICLHAPSSVTAEQYIQCIKGQICSYRIKLVSTGILACYSSRIWVWSMDEFAVIQTLGWPQLTLFWAWSTVCSMENALE